MTMTLDKAYGLFFRALALGSALAWGGRLLDKLLPLGVDRFAQFDAMFGNPVLAYGMLGIVTLMQLGIVVLFAIAAWRGPKSSSFLLAGGLVLFQFLFFMAGDAVYAHIDKIRPMFERHNNYAVLWLAIIAGTYGIGRLLGVCPAEAAPVTPAGREVTAIPIDTGSDEPRQAA